MNQRGFILSKKEKTFALEKTLIKKYGVCETQITKKTEITKKCHKKLVLLCTSSLLSSY
jgi:hypothetical protein